MNTGRHVRFFRNGRNWVIRIPREFEVDAVEAIISREDDRLVIEPIRKKGLLATLSTLHALDEGFPDADKGMPRLDDAALLRQHIACMHLFPTRIAACNEGTIQLFAAGQWHDVASVTLLGDAVLGWRTATYTAYATECALLHTGSRDAWALGSQLPVGLRPWRLGHWPVFLLDMLPQGYGRGELLRHVGLPETAEADADWPLLVNGAGNPIGHLRVKEAAKWLADRTGAVRGFTDEEVAARSEDFMHYLSLHGLFVAGSSGCKGSGQRFL